jgi:hypothetical protein
MHKVLDALRALYRQHLDFWLLAWGIPVPEDEED